MMRRSGSQTSRDEMKAKALCRIDSSFERDGFYIGQGASQLAPVIAGVDEDARAVPLRATMYR